MSRRLRYLNDHTVPSRVMGIIPAAFLDAIILFWFVSAVIAICHRIA